MWPFYRRKREEKQKALARVLAEQAAATQRLQDNLRRAHAKNLNEILAKALPQHEVPEK